VGEGEEEVNTELGEEEGTDLYDDRCEGGWEGTSRVSDWNGLICWHARARKGRTTAIRARGMSLAGPRGMFSVMVGQG
jgi:hypothetical protein